MPRRLFTPASAKSTVESIRSTVEFLIHTVREMDRRRPRPPRGDQPVEREYYALVCRLRRLLRAIRARGVEVDNLRSGRLAFPIRHAGKPAVLYWTIGEPGPAFDPAAGDGPDRDDGEV